jgi:hypothetical protein
MSPRKTPNEGVALKSHGSGADRTTSNPSGLALRAARKQLARMPAKAQLMLGIFLFAAVLMGLHTALSGKDASLHLELQHDFRSADLSVWIDGDLAYSGKLIVSLKKRFGLT